MNQKIENEVIHPQNRQLIEARLDAVRDARPFSLQSVGKLDGVWYINDSAATHIDHTAASLSAFDEKVIWVVEAPSSIKHLSHLAELAAEKTKVVVAIGPNAAKGFAFFSRINILYITADTWDEAIDMCRLSALTDDVVLFSPACRAHEPFQNYKERGAYFNQLLKIKGINT